MSGFARQPTNYQSSVDTGTAKGAPAAVPGKRTLTQDLTPYSHVDPSVRPEPSDEKPIDWTRGFKLVVPGGPMVKRQVVPGPECYQASNSVPARVLDCHSPASPEPRLGNPMVITSDQAAHRQRCWTAWRLIAVPVQQRHDAAVPEIQRYFAADRDPRLVPLGILVPKGRRNTTLAALVNSQELPVRGGHTVESLFRPDGKLDIATDSPAVQRAASGAGDDHYLAVTAADRQLAAVLKRVKAGAQQVQVAAEKLERARAAIELAAAQHKAAEAEAEVRELGERAARAGEALGFMREGTEGIVELIERGAAALTGGPLLGSLSTMVFSAVTAGPLSEAKKRLKAAREDVDTKSEQVLRHGLAAAGIQADEKVTELEGLGFELEAAMATRRVAYDKAGQHAGKLAGGDEGAAIAAAYAAYPLAETVHGVADGIVRQLEHACPEYDPLAAIGLGIGVSHGDEAARNFCEAVEDQQIYAWYFGEVRDDWAVRLEQFRALRNHIEGERPGDQ